MRANVRLALTGLFVFLCMSVFPTSQASVPDTIVARQGSVLPVWSLRQPDAKSMDAYRDDPALQYERNQDNWLKKIQDWLREHLHWNISPEEESLDLSGWDILVLVIGGVLVLYVVYLLIRYKYKWAFRRMKQYAVPDVSEVCPENVDGASYSSSLEKAIHEKDFALAVRIHHWYLLYLLDREGVIAQDRCKTNVAYLYEIKDPRIKAMFQKASRVFDCVCYGEFSIDEPVFRVIEKDFKMFQQEIGG